ncbi:hypothetical protein BSLA_01f1684 [Burkholderia stabilis]|nr:hypothetical protein BSLA_01f1684 [Burkholderia stabilis]
MALPSTRAESGATSPRTAAYRRPTGGGTLRQGPAVMMTRASGFASRIGIRAGRRGRRGCRATQHG